MLDVVSIDPQGNVLPPTPDLPDRNTARRAGHPKYRDDAHPCRDCGDPMPVRYTAGDRCMTCTNTRPRGH